MGTSVNQRSPDTPSWRIVQRTYEDSSIPLERALQEIWRAATHQQESDLGRQLSQPVILELADVSARADSPAEASRLANEVIATSKAASLGADLARRAAIQAAGRPDAGQLFVERLFAEATGYLVSRDLAGHISEGKRLPTVSAAREFRAQLTSIASKTASSLSVDGSPLASSEIWAGYVSTVLNAIKQRHGGSTS